MKKIIFSLGLAMSLLFLPGITKAAITTTPLVPSNNATSYNVHTTLMQWKPVANKSYKLQIRVGDKNFTASDEFSEVIPTNYILADNLKTESMEAIKNDGKSYYWRVKVNEDGAPWSSSYKFTTIGVILPAVITYPKLVKNVPPLIDENTGNYNFTWKNKAGTNYNTLTFYKATKDGSTWQCSTESVYVYKIPVKGEKFSTKFLAVSLANGDYCWKVTSYNSGEGVSTSEPGYFTYKRFYLGQTLTSDPLFAQAIYGKVIMYWTKNINFESGVERYAIRVSSSPKMEANLRVEHQTLETNYYIAEPGSPIYDFVKANAGKDLYWQVGFRNVWSKVGKFKSQL